jgi:D-lactate dehydrogenase (cytochrome)
MHATNIYGMSKRKWAEKDSLFIKFQGPNQNFLKDSVMMAKVIAKQHGALGFELAKDDKEAEDLWADRKNAHFAGLALIRGCRGWPTDVWYLLTFLNSFGSRYLTT